MRPEIEESAIYMLTWEQWSHYWGQIEECIDETDFGQYYTKDWLNDAVYRSHVQAWVLSDGTIRLVCFTRILMYPKDKVLQLFWAYGRGMDTALEMANEIMDRAAVVMEATRIEIVGRAGWWKKMRRFGFDRDWWTISRPVNVQRGH